MQNAIGCLAAGLDGGRRWLFRFGHECIDNWNPYCTGMCSGSWVGLHGAFIAGDRALAGARSGSKP